MQAADARAAAVLGAGMQAADAGAAAVQRTADAGADGPDDPGDAGSGDAERAALALASGGAAAPAARGPEGALHNFALSVPFPTPLEAEIACGSLAPDGEPHRAAIQKELTVAGGVLAVRWTAEDPRLLRISITNFLDQLSLVVRTMQRFGPPVSR
ncbi:EKC/KEOPS complex subunit LAGE3-like [Dasypus novemcinctus]|uniref:EKC/KEOPS complex subunit LAGE3-like n=1 Tax=Dasypus novemcinctus TaxID=9361 RepID=UPI0003290C3D|nr:EKC/KEOPS complex subunit LAGE3-like [Dasypus novemcinctus]